MESWADMAEEEEMVVGDGEDVIGMYYQVRCNDCKTVYMTRDISKYIPPPIKITNGEGGIIWKRAKGIDCPACSHQWFTLIKTITHTKAAPVSYTFCSRCKVKMTTPATSPPHICPTCKLYTRTTNVDSYTIK